MKIINIRESLKGMDIDTNFRHNLTGLYESLILNEDKKEKLVKYIDAYDIDATNKFLSNEFSSQGLMEYYEDDEFDDDELASIYGGDTTYCPDCGAKKVYDEDGFAYCAKCDESLNEDINESQLETEIKETVKNSMMEFGFPEDDALAYSVVEIKPTESGDMLQVEVRAELNYEDITKLSDKLDTIVQKYDPNAYFEPVMPGIIEAFVSVEETDNNVDPELVELYTEQINACNTLDELREVYLDFKKFREHMSQGTVEEINVVLDAKIDLITAETGDPTIRESLEEGIFDKIKSGAKAVGNKIKTTTKNELNSIKDAKYRIDADKAQQAKESSSKDKASATSKIKDTLGGEIDMTRAGKDEEELTQLDRQVSGDKVASKPDYSNNKKGTTKTGHDLEKAIVDAYKRGEVYLSDIGESLEEDYIDDDISFFGDYDYYDDEDTTFFEGGMEYEWVDKRITSHDAKDMDGFLNTWYVASAKSIDDGETYYFVIDDTDFIDWGPCDTEDEAREFVLAKDSDYDDLDEAKKKKGNLLNRVNKALKENVDDEISYEVGIAFNNSSYEFLYEFLDSFDNKEEAITYAKEQTKKLSDDEYYNDGDYIVVVLAVPEDDEGGNASDLEVARFDINTSLDESKKRKGSLKDKVNKALKESRPDKDIKTTTNKVTIKYGNSVKEVETCKPIKVTNKQLDSYKDNYSIVDVLDESKSINEENELSTEHAKESIVDAIKRVYECGGFDKLPVGREDAVTIDIAGPDKDRLVGYFEKQPEFKYDMNNESDIISHEFISDKYDVEVFDTFIQMYKIPQTESLEEQKLEESSLLDKVNAALAREENNI